jgi:hypothetical protein
MPVMDLGSCCRLLANNFRNLSLPGSLHRPQSCKPSMDALLAVHKATILKLDDHKADTSEGLSRDNHQMTKVAIIYGTEPSRPGPSLRVLTTTSSMTASSSSGVALTAFQGVRTWHRRPKLLPSPFPPSRRHIDGRSVYRESSQLGGLAHRKEPRNTPRRRSKTSIWG